MQQDNDRPNDQQRTQAAASGMAWMNEQRPVLTQWEQAENEAAWWDATLDADVFFRRPNIPCEWAALLLCRFNPHHDTREVAEVTHTDETTPNDFKRLLSTFEGRAEAGAEAHSLLDWMAVATGDGLKTHSWAWSYVAHRFGILGPQSPAPEPATAPEPAKKETPKERRARWLEMYEAEEKQQPRGALQRLADREGVDRSNMAKDIGKARDARDEQKRAGMWTSQLVQDGKRTR